MGTYAFLVLTFAVERQYASGENAVLGMPKSDLVLRHRQKIHGQVWRAGFDARRPDQSRRVVGHRLPSR